MPTALTVTVVNLMNLAMRKERNHFSEDFSVDRQDIDLNYCTFHFDSRMSRTWEPDTASSPC